MGNASKRSKGRKYTRINAIAPRIAASGFGGPNRPVSMIGGRSVFRAAAIALAKHMRISK